MKTTSLKDFRSRIGELVEGDEPILVTRDGKHAAVLYPLNDPTSLPIEIRRDLFRDITQGVREKLDALGVTDEEIERDFEASRNRRRGQ